MSHEHHHPPGDPCRCPPRPCTKCDRDTQNNVWHERGTPGAIGICLLDTMTEEQIIYTLEHDERARKDLLRVTSDPHLLHLAHTITRLPVVEEMDAMQKDMNREGPATNVLHSTFHGVPPFVSPLSR